MLEVRIKPRPSGPGVHNLNNKQFKKQKSWVQLVAQWKYTVSGYT